MADKNSNTGKSVHDSKYVYRSALIRAVLTSTLGAEISARNAAISALSTMIDLMATSDDEEAASSIINISTTTDFASEVEWPCDIVWIRTTKNPDGIRYHDDGTPNWCICDD